MPERRIRDRRKGTVTVRRWQIGIAFTLTTLAFVVGLIWLTHLTHQNRDRINDIQHEHVAACRQSYESVRKIFEPFFSKHPKSRQRRQIVKFNLTITRLEHACLIEAKAHVR